jgi:cytoskeleton-associated protein 5
MTIISRQSSVHANLNSDLIACLKSRLSDSNKNLASFSVEILGKLALSIGKPLEKYVRTFVPPMLSQLSDQKIAVRTIVLSNLDKVYDVVGFSPLVACIVAALSTEQPQIRKDLLSWLSSEGKDIDFDVNDANSMIPCILACLLDRTVEVRKAALAVLLRLSLKVDASAIRAKAADLYHGAQYSTLAPHLDSLGFKNIDSPITNNTSQTTSLKTDLLKPSKSNVKTAAKGSSGNSKKDTTLSTASAVLAVSSESPNQFALTSDDLKFKDHRSTMDRGVLKWSFDTPRKELIDLLADQCSGNLNGELISLLFSTDHYKERDFLNGLQQLDSFLSSNEIAKATVIQRAISNCDLLLRYLSIRFFDTNTSIFIKSLDLLETLISILDEGGYLLNEFEASSFLPYFINKVSINSINCQTVINRKMILLLAG